MDLAMDTFFTPEHHTQHDRPGGHTYQQQYQEQQQVHDLGQEQQQVHDPVQGQSGGDLDIMQKPLLELVGDEVAESCGVDVDSTTVKQLRGIFTADGPIDIWDVGPEEVTSDEDLDGTVKPKLGAGRHGQGRPRKYITTVRSRR